MEPISTSVIVSALVAGASSALKDTTNQAIKDAYQGLKSLVKEHWKSKATSDNNTQEIEAKIFLDNLEDDPHGFHKILERKLNEIIIEPDTKLIEQAQQLTRLLQEVGYSSGKYTINIEDNNQGVQIGDGGTQTNHFK